jgi:hypothetical protein
MSGGPGLGWERTVELGTVHRILAIRCTQKCFVMDTGPDKRDAEKGQLECQVAGQECACLKCKLAGHKKGCLQGLGRMIVWHALRQGANYYA